MSSESSQTDGQPNRPELSEGARALLADTYFPWHYRSLCYGQDPKKLPFFPDRETRSAIERARRYCQPCPVKLNCLESALDYDAKVSLNGGIWAGFSAEQRRLIRRRHLNLTALIKAVYGDRFFLGGKLPPLKSFPTAPPAEPAGCDIIDPNT